MDRERDPSNERDDQRQDVRGYFREINDFDPGFAVLTSAAEHGCGEFFKPRKVQHVSAAVEHETKASIGDFVFKPGNLVAVSYDSNNNVISQDALLTTGEAKSIKLNLYAHPGTGLIADGADMVMAEVEVQDANGITCPLANDLITFDIQGPVEFIGGLAKGKDNYVRSKTIPVECGINRVLLRSTRQPGKIKLIAKSGSLKPDTIEFESSAFDAVDGLSKIIRGNELYCRLSRGATPSNPSYKVSRIPVSAIESKAGANQETAMNVIDDNEMTEWRNSGTRSTGWLDFTLSRPANLSEICLKLTGWRNRSYKLRVLSDNGTLLWEGETARSLGYITLPMSQVVSTRNVRIELSGAGSQKEGFSRKRQSGLHQSTCLFE